MRISVLAALLSFGAVTTVAAQDVSMDLPRTDWSESVATESEVNAQTDMGMGLFVGGRLAYTEARGADEGDVAFGAEIGFGFGSIVKLRLAIDYIPEQEYLGGFLKVKTYSPEVAFLFSPIPNLGVEPYILGGLGWDIYDIEVPTIPALSDTDSQFTWNLGLGLRSPSGPGLYFGGEFKYKWVDEPNVADDTDFDSWQGTFSIGIQL